MEYPITGGGNAVGTALLERQGMFWLVRCKCAVSDEQPLKVYLLCDTQRIDLGLCAMGTDGYGLLSRISVKAGEPERFIFTAEPLYDEQYYPVAEDGPFPMLQYLDSAKFLLRNGKAGILVRDQIPISKPTGQ